MRQPDYISKDGTVRLYRGDCLAILPELEAGSVDAVVTDPPYAVPTVVAQGRSVTSNLGDLSLIESVFRGLFDNFVRVVGASGRIFVFCDGTSYPVLFRAVYGRVSMALLVWSKNGIGMGREFRKSHELILHGWGPETPIFSDGVGRPDVLRCSTVSDSERVHAAEKPVELISELLRPCATTILDPFMGSGTTGVACVRTGRKFIGIEIDEGYFNIAVRRIEEAFDSQGLFRQGERASA